ncbi:MAG: LamG-like jellyroll fold domain-containing protein [Verrucomicrobiota bacterium]
MKLTSPTIFVGALAIIALNTLLLAADPELLLRWPAHEGTGAVVQDTSGNGLDGRSTAGWVGEGGIKALFFDGQSKSVVRVQVPAGKYLGAGDWSFMAWLRPEVLGFPGKQDQRRIFNYGKYPDASVNFDLTGQGALSWYLVYKDANGKSVSAGGGSVPRFKPRTWLHTALVVDRRNARVTVYLNGRESGQGPLPQGWAANFNLGNELMIGSGWQNFHGAMADVAVWRRTLGEAEIKSLFRTQSPAYGVKLGDGMTAEEVLGDLAELGNDAMAQKKTAEARTAFDKLLTTPGVPPGWAAWAELRIAQAHRLDRNDAAAKAVYQHIQGQSAYLAHHRQEAAELQQEMERTAKGLPARDVMATRTVLPVIDHYAAEVWIAPDGNDAYRGQATKPVATLNRAQALVRELRRTVTGPVAVIFKNGEYQLHEGLKLTAEDSGAPTAPVVWKAAESGKVVLYGGMRLKGFAPVADASVVARLDPKARGNVMVCDLKQLGLTDYGRLAVRGYSQPPSPPTVELFVNGEPQTLARWPNDGFVDAGKLIEPGNKTNGTPSVFEYLDDRHARWTNAEDAWLFGYWRYLWADATLKIGKLDTASKRITSAQPYWMSHNGMDTKQGIKYYAFNLLEELDRPGEWYLDRSQGLLYLWPTGDPSRQTIELGVLSSPFMTLTKTAHVRFEGLVCDLGRFDGIQISGGENVQLVGCVVRRMAGSGITISGGTRHTLLGCDIHHLGRAATTLKGGNRATLERADFLIENCHLHHFGRIDRTYTPAIQAEGVGMRFAHNLMHDCPSSAIRVDGNDVLMEYNDVHSVLRESDDQGGMETFGNPSFRGLVFRYNRFENVGNGSTMVNGQSAIRFDDVISGMLVYGNLFIRSANGHFGALQINGGRDDIMDNNLFVDCKLGISGRYWKNHKHWTASEQGVTRDVFRTPLYLQRYPEIANMFDGNGRNFAWRMALIDCGTPIVQKAFFDILALRSWTSKDPGIAELAKRQWNLAADSELVLRLGLRPIPLAEIGLYADRTRASWPVITTPVEVPDWREAVKPRPWPE